MQPLQRILSVDRPRGPADGHSGLRLAALERGVVLHARDLGKLKTCSQAIAAAVGGLVAAGAWSDSLAWWALLIALVLTWLSALDYARVAPGLLRGRAVA
jgi:phosphatidylglycerophosphate synthase